MRCKRKKMNLQIKEVYRAWEIKKKIKRGIKTETYTGNFLGLYKLKISPRRIYSKKAKKMEGWRGGVGRE